MGGSEPERQHVPQPHGGVLTPHPPGSNGDVQRGPDRFPRRNYVRMMFLGALSDLGLNLEDLRRQRKHRKGSSLVPHAMLHHCKQGYENIAIDAALGKPEAYGPFLRMMADLHTMLQPAKDEVARAHDRVPFPATFVWAPAAAPPDAESSPQPPARSPAPAPGPLDGYVEA